MHILVTGATGFIGSHLCGNLLNNGYKVTGISRYPRKTGFERENEIGNLHMKYCNIVNENDIMNLFDKIGSIDGIFHMAGQTYRNDSPSIHSYFLNNFKGTMNILECCRIFNIRRFVFGSSYAVYGLGVGQYVPTYSPVDESHIVKPYDFYDISKYHAEQICKFYHERFGITNAILRYSKIYGPGLQEGVVYEVIQKALENLPIEVNGDISTDFLFIDDAVKAALEAFEKVSDFQVFNIGSGQSPTLYSLCSKIIELSESKSQINYSKKITGHLSLDISKARRFLEYEPTKLEDGLSTHINYIRNQKYPIQI
jgi:UDP-glucose 4-epimerase